MEPILNLHNVTLEYRMRDSLGSRVTFRALNNISYAFGRGETIGVVGRNGSGKSTLLKVLAGIAIPTAGRMETRGSPSRALLSLGPGFKRQLSGRDNALLGAMLQGRSKTEALELLPAIEEYADLGRFFDLPIRTYSSGMRARLGFATALVARADLLLIDETLGVGDANFRRKAERSIRARKNPDQTVVVVSHSIPQIKRLCHRILWLEEGNLMESGDPGEVLPRYQNFNRQSQTNGRQS